MESFIINPLNLINFMDITEINGIFPLLIKYLYIVWIVFFEQFQISYTLDLDS